MTSIRRRLVAGIIGMVAFAAAPAAFAQSTSGATNLGTFTAWTAWQGQDQTGMVCFIAADPESSEPKEVGGKPINRDPAVFLVVHRKGLGIRNEAQTLIGYPFSGEQRPSATIDGQTFPMLSENSSAWLADAAQESTFLTALKAGSKLVVSGTSARGTKTTDTYSLSGVTAAMAAIDKACS